MIGLRFLHRWLPLHLARYNIHQLIVKCS